MIRTSLRFTTNAGKTGQSIGAEPLSRQVGVRTAPARKPRGCDYREPAALFVREASRLRYQAFESAALALQHANENLSSRQLLSCTMEVGDIRFAGDEIQRLYLSTSYPLPRAAAESAETAE